MSIRKESNQKQKFAEYSKQYERNQPFRFMGEYSDPIFPDSIRSLEGENFSPPPVFPRKEAPASRYDENRNDAQLNAPYEKDVPAPVSFE